MWDVIILVVVHVKKFVTVKQLGLCEWLVSHLPPPDCIGNPESVCIINRTESNSKNQLGTE